MVNPFDLEKQRELLFTAEPAGQVTRALELLGELPNLKTVCSENINALDVHYSLEYYTLAGLENALEQEGFLLDRSFLHQISRNIIHYCEDTCRHNMEIRGYVTKQNEKGVFVEVCGQHTHHELAAKPPEQREYE